MQKYKEARARYGSRYVEYLRYLGVTPKDGRLDRPEYLAGGKSYINISEVLNTGDGTGTIGDLVGHGISAVQTNKYNRFIEEHGYIMTMMSLRPVCMYGKGIQRKYTKTAKEDYFHKELERIGAQEIYNKEIYSQHGTPEGVFGYTDRYREYREEQNIITGEMVASDEDEWHMPFRIVTGKHSFRCTML